MHVHELVPNESRVAERSRIRARRRISTALAMAVSGLVGTGVLFFAIESASAPHGRVLRRPQADISMIMVNGVSRAVPANRPRADVDRVFHVIGNHGSSATVAGHPGLNSVCVYTSGTIGIAERLLSCRAVAA